MIITDNIYTHTCIFCFFHIVQYPTVSFIRPFFINNSRFSLNFIMRAP
uniref:Uncharacterized protein n=1 Tax=Amphimedon queenslandica TaxID=400682 RepID=A0A1X7T590_AMPQE